MLSTHSRSSIELDLRSSQGEPTGNRNRSLPDQSGNPDGSEQHEAQFLEPTDGGASAWRVLLAAFVFEALFYGFPLSYGLFQNYYAQLSEFSDNSLLSVVGSCATGIAFLGAPLMVPFVRRHPKRKVLMICVGWSLCILGLMAGSFANSLPTLIITQGVMYGVGFVIFYYPIISIVNEWWVARRGMAWGVIVSAGGVTGVAIPFIIEAMLNKYGYKITLRAVALALVVLTGPLIPFFKGRLPFSQQTAAESTDWSFMKKPVFWVYCASNIAQGFGFYFPALYLPSYATSIGLSSTQGALLLALVSVAQVFGQFTFGILSDGRLPLNLLAVISTVVAAIATLALWGLAQSLAPLVLFSLIYGFFGYGFAALRSRLGTAVTGEPTAALAIFSIFCCGQGIGNVLAGPISATLLSGALHPSSYGAVKYRMVVIFTGACMVASALSIGSLYLRPRRLRSV